VNFVSTEFLVLMAIVLAVRLVIGARTNGVVYLAVLVAASLTFYAWHVPIYLLILLASTSVDYVAALLLPSRGEADLGRRRLVLTISLATNLGLLGLFKYGGLVAEGVRTVAASAGLPFAPVMFDVVLPMGISFYTFEAMSYTIDVYRGRMAPIRSFPRFVLFIVFFPHLVAGPIVRAWQFLPQLTRRRALRLVVAYQGVWLIVTGYFLKTVCADNLAAHVDANWEQGYQPGAGIVVAGSLAVMFAGQIFADFAGYSNIARGLAYLLGFRLPVNFNAPYIAGSFKNFWERWHITLSQWLRDYLYVPLGGNRGSVRRTYLNLMVVMVLGGLWHGAALTFVAWGFVHGAALAIERAIGAERLASRILSRVAWFAVVQIVVLAAWVFFRSDSLGHAMSFLDNLVRPPAGERPAWLFPAAVFLAPLVAWHGWVWVVERLRPIEVPPLFRVAAAAAMVWAILNIRGETSSFIYFQF